MVTRKITLIQVISSRIRFIDQKEQLLCHKREKIRYQASLRKINFPMLSLKELRKKSGKRDYPVKVLLHLMQNQKKQILKWEQNQTVSLNNTKTYSLHSYWVKRVKEMQIATYPIIPNNIEAKT